MPARIRELAALYVLDPSAEDAELDTVLDLAGNRASVTADAAGLIEDESELGHQSDSALGLFLYLFQSCRTIF
jgi:hypothetical protein